MLSRSLVITVSILVSLIPLHCTDLHSAEECFFLTDARTSGASAPGQRTRSSSQLCDLRLMAGSPVSNARLVPPRPQSPHWEHIAISDFARGYYWTGDLTKDADRQWLAARIDLLEGNSTRDPYVQAMRQWNPTLAVFQYRLDHYDFVNDQSRAFPESHVLHISTPTRMMLKGRDIAGQELSFASGDRFQFLVWNDRYFAFNLKNPATRQWNIDRLLADLDGLQGLFLDAHAPDFPSLIGITNGQTRITNGGAIVEYGDRIPTDPVLIQDYQKDMVTWLGELAAAAKTKGKFILLNQASYMLDPAAKQQQLAAQGTGTEFMHQPLAWAGWYQYADYLAFTKQLVDAGGVIDAEGHWCYTGGLDRARWNMWRLAAYYQIKAPVGSPGKVYFNLALCSNATLHPSNDRDEWLPAFQVDVGQPAGQTSLFQEGKAGTATSDGRQCDYKIYGRDYTKALVLVRPKDFWDCIDFGDGAAVTVTLPRAMRLLKADGSLGEPSTTTRLKNAEAAIFIKESL